MSDPIDPRVVERMNAVARALDDIFEGFGFALLVFDMDTTIGGKMKFISNARLEDVLVAMEVFVAKHEWGSGKKLGRA